jgi:isopropylmalate/homocitrate/citramalate synthase
LPGEEFVMARTFGLAATLLALLAGTAQADTILYGIGPDGSFPSR